MNLQCKGKISWHKKDQRVEEQYSSMLTTLPSPFALIWVVWIMFREENHIPLVPPALSSQYYSAQSKSFKPILRQNSPWNQWEFCEKKDWIGTKDPTQFSVELCRPSIRTRNMFDFHHHERTAGPSNPNSTLLLIPASTGQVTQNRVWHLVAQSTFIK